MPAYFQTVPNRDRPETGCREHREPVSREAARLPGIESAETSVDSVE
jgi:hypothetical protein